MESRSETSDADRLIDLFDARDPLEVARLGDILAETIHCLDPGLARDASKLPALRLKGDPQHRRKRRRRSATRAASPSKAPARS
jgi:hypothetical protein